MTKIKQVEKTLNRLKEKTQEVFGNGITPEFTIKYDLKDGRALGRVTYKKGLNPVMHLNKTLLESFGDTYINEVVIHEYVHLVVRKRFPDGKVLGKRVMPHGIYFKSTGRLLGVDQNTLNATTNTFGETVVIKRTQRKWNYTCECGTYHIISTRRHNLIRYKNKSYICTKCKSRIFEIKD